MRSFHILHIFMIFCRPNKGIYKDIHKHDAWKDKQETCFPAEDSTTLEWPWLTPNFSGLGVITSNRSLRDYVKNHTYIANLLVYP